MDYGFFSVTFVVITNESELSGVARTRVVGDVDVANVTELSEEVFQSPFVQSVPLGIFLSTKSHLNKIDKCNIALN